ncbi:S-layer homology domain-containing protein, partial [Cohnella mopanensis]|uniref:S-layer homology domain-containing protein n=1 Tax=Cohnella mopanensis TaxID=2911966 RepID=UPI001EF7A928
PNTATRTISFTVNDGSDDSNTATKIVTVADTNQSPIVTTSWGNSTFTASSNATSTPVVIDSGITVSDLDNTTLASATVAITGNFHSGEDVLAFSNTSAVTYGNITASYNSATGVMTLTSSGATATLARWQSALSAVTYTDTAITPNSVTRTISFTVNDGSDYSNTATKNVTVTVLNQSPIVTTSGGSSAFVSGNNSTSTPVAVDSGITVSDLDNTTLASATVAITGNFHSGEDVLAFSNTSAVTYGNITASYNSATGVMTLTSSGATATLARWQSALSAVTYTDTAITPNSVTRTISFTVNDGSDYSNTATKNVTVTVLNQSPIVTTSGGSSAFVSGNNSTSTPVAVDSGITVSDLDNTTLASATVAITGNFHSGEDVLAFSNTSAVTYGNITASYNSATGVMTLTSSGATATLARWQSALRAVTYTDTAITPNSVTRTISFTVSDGSANSNTATKNVTVAATNHSPIVTTSGGNSAFTASNNVTSTPIAVDSGITVSDLDSSTLASATVAITGNFQAGEDVLGFINDGATNGNITASYNSATGAMTLTSLGASATLVQWQSALSAVTYTDSAITPNTATRTISITVNDGSANSNTATKNVNVTAVVRLSANPQTITVQRGNTASTAITADYSNQSQLDVTPFTAWTVQSPAVATVAGGIITGNATGSTVITATYGGQSVSINLTVTSPSYTGGGSFDSLPNSTGKDPIEPAKEPPIQKNNTFKDIVNHNQLVTAVSNALTANKSAIFNDTKSHWATNNISLAAKLGIISGYPDGSFQPDAEITRAEFSAMIVKAFNLALGDGNISFPDIQNNWARTSIEILASNGVISGYPDGTFKADQTISRAEMVKIISKIVNLIELKSSAPKSFADVGPQYWAKNVIDDAATAGIISGRDATHFFPNDKVMRSEAVTVIINSLKADPAISAMLKQ